MWLATPRLVERVSIDLAYFVNTLSEKFEYPVVITLVALAAVLIEAVAIARRATRP